MKMEESFKEIGKGFISLANLLMVVIFFKEYIGNSDILTLLSGIYAGILFYILGGLMVFIGENQKKETYE